MWAIISTVVSDWKTLYDAEHNLLAIAKFLILLMLLIVVNCNAW